MHTRNYISTVFTTLTALLMMVVSLPVCSQEIALQDTLLVNDSLAVDTIVTNDPEWYVAPMTHDLSRAPFRAPAAECPIDSVRTFSVDSVLESVSIYEYGDTTRTMIWTVNSDGTRYGSGREESASAASSTYKATYAWDKTTNDWAGVSREEHYFAAGKDTAWLVYTWVNNAWVVNTKYTYVRDASGRETEFTTYQRNAVGQLAYAQRREKTYNAAGLMILDIQYGSYTDGAWVGSAKYVYDYNAAGTQTLYEYYPSCVNGVWNGSVRNVYDFDAAGNKVLEEKYSGMTDGAWKGSSKYTAVFNAGKEVEHVNYKWVAASKSWQENIKYAKTYDGENLTDDASYIWNNGWVGNARTTKTYSGSLVASEIIWQWDSNNAVWTSKSKTETQYTGSKISVQIKSVWDGADWLNLSQLTNTYQSDLLAESYTRSWKEGDWQDSLRILNTYDEKKINTLSVSAAWNGTQWLSTDSTTRDVIYTTIAGNDYVVEDVTMAWSSKNNMWTGIKRDTKEYDAWGNVIQSDTYTYFSGTGWVNNVRHLYAYKDGNKNLETLNAYLTWNKTKGVWSGTTKTEKEYDDTNRLVKTSTYKWNTTHNDWEGLASTEDIYENGIKVTSYSYKWDAATWDWTGMFKHDYTYAASGKIAEQIDWRYDVNTGWYYDVKIANTYDAKGRTVKADRYQWIRTESQWCMTSTNETVYDADADGGKLRSEIVASGSNCEITSYARKLYFYSCDPKLAFTIRFENEDGTLLESKKVVSGTVPTYDGETPTKENTAQYTYSFKGWDKAIVAATSDATYVAMFDSIVNAYLITFKNGEEVLQSEPVAYGTVPAYNGEQPAKQSNAQYTYSFKGWDAEIVAVTGEATYSAMFDSIVNTYLVTFKNGEEVLQSEVLAYGTVPAYNGEKPAKQSNAQYTYSFKGWDAEIVAVTGEATYSAMFDSIVNTYLVTFKNGESILQSEPVAYGTVPAYNGEQPAKQTNAQYTYSFNGWDAEIVAVTGEATYSAMFDSIVNTYLVTFKNGESILQSEPVAYGTVPAYDGEKPAKQSNAQYTYSFKGWDAEIVAVTGEATYSAMFDSIVNTYLVTFKNGESILQSEPVAYGTVPTYNGQTPTKPADEQHSYVFAGWDAELVAVTDEATYTATFTVTEKTYVITWLNNDGSEIGRDTLKYGATPTPAEATKENTAEFTYTFTGWDKAIVPVAGDATYTAQYDSVRNKYTITFYFDDGKTVIETMVVEYGQMPDPTKTPSKIAEEHHYYTFAGWEPALAPVTGDASYKAVFDEVPQEYLITFKNYNGVVLQKKNVAYGSIPEYTGATPTKPRTQQYSYTFAGWSPELTEVSGAATYTARYEEVLNQYTIIFVDEDGTELEHQEVEYGKKPVYQGETPVKAEDEQYTYTFAGWTPAIVAVTKNATYRATYTPHDKSQGLWDVQDGAATSTKVIRNGTLYIIRAGKTYTTDGVLVEQ